MKITRRNFLHSGSMSGLALGAMELSPRRAIQSRHIGGPDLLNEVDVFPTAVKAVDAAIAAGAAYADVRVIRSVSQSFRVRDENIGQAEVNDSQELGIGVRVLINGCFGFAASPYLDIEEAGILAKTAVEQAKVNSDIRPRSIEWASAPVQSGRWISIGEDPFLVPIEERVEFVNSWREEAKGYRDGLNATKLTDSMVHFIRTEKFLVTSEGTKISQVIYEGGGSLSVAALPRFTKPLSGPHVGSVGGIEPQLGGWEIIKKSNPSSQIPSLVADAAERSKIGIGIFDVGRYDLVLDGNFAGNLLSNTFGKATQLDLALGYEANAEGTSYLGPNISEVLGTQVANSLVSVSCDRSGPNKLATVKWDDEGVPTREFNLIKDGMLMNYQAARDIAFKIKEWQKSSKVDDSLQGCSYASTGYNIPIQSAPNMKLLPGAKTCTLADMISEIKRGYLITGGFVSTTFGVQEGLGTPSLSREIRDGKLRDYIPGFQIMFNTAEIWKNVVRLGDVSTVRRSQGQTRKGEPAQRHAHSVDSAAISVKDAVLIDPTRKA